MSKKKLSKVTHFREPENVKAGDLIYIDYSDEPCYAIALEFAPKNRGIRSPSGDQHKTIRVLQVPPSKGHYKDKAVSDTNGATYNFVSNTPIVKFNNLLDELRVLNGSRR